MKLFVPSFAIIGLLATSCATSSFVSDDVYSVKPSELAIGESTADETSYASFRSRKTNSTNDRVTYADEMYLINRQNCLEQWRWYDGCGCSYTEWLRSSRYSPGNRNAFFTRPHSMIQTSYYFRMNSFYGNSYMPFYGNPYNSFGGYHYAVGYWGGGGNFMYPYNSHMSFGNYSSWGGYDPYFYNSPYGPYGYYGYGYGGYGYGGNMNGWHGNGWNNNSGNNNSHSNVVRGPRGTASSGYSNPNGRTTSSQTVKSTAARPTDKGAPVAVGNTGTAGRTVREVASREVISPSTAPRSGAGTAGRVGVERGSTATTTSSPSRTGATTTSTTQRESNYQRTYPSRTNSSAPSTVGRTSTGNSSTGSSGTSGRTTTYERSSGSNSGSSYSSPSRSSSGSSGSSGSSSSGSSGGRSGGSTGSSSSGGRR